MPSSYTPPTTAVASTAIVFPGQGSQHPGMAAEFMQHPATRELFQAVDDALSTSLSRLMRDGPEADLTLTHNAQPALLTAGLAALIYLETQANRSLHQLAACVAGHSLGEYTAVSAAGGMSAVTAAKLVTLRGHAMAKAVPYGEGAMTAVLGLDVATLETIAQRADVVIANDNAPGQLILAGRIPQLMEAEDAARNAGAKRVLRLSVSGPFHTPAMQPAAQAVADFLQQHPLKPLELPCYGNATAAAATAPESVAANLIAQITGRVRWREIMQQMAGQGVTQVLELGSGKVLAGLAPRSDARLSALSLTTPAAIDTWLTTAGF